LAGGGSSALERMAARLLTQRAYLADAARRIAAMAGPVFEIGLGKGRTYDHLRRLLAGRDIYCFDRDLHAPGAESPPPDRLVLGEIRETLPALAARIGRPAVLAHCDIGSRHLDRDLAFARDLAGLLPDRLAPGAIVLGDRPMESPRLEPLPAPDLALPAGLEPWPYHLYRNRAAISAPA
jgi:hypothetical protein